VLGEVGKLPEVFSELEINFFLLRRLLGVRSKEGEKQSKVGHPSFDTDPRAPFLLPSILPRELPPPRDAPRRPPPLLPLMPGAARPCGRR
jgi:hypothetical protein